MTRSTDGHEASDKVEMKMSREQFLLEKPARASGVLEEHTDDGGLRVSVPVKRMWLFKLPEGSRKTFELDEVGKFVWDHCDSRTTLQRIIEAVSKKYKLNLREAEVATLKFLDMLSRRRLIGVSREKRSHE
jgi:hypothetical protein